MVNTRLLVVLDDSAASRSAVKYVGKFVGKRRRFRICLVHVLPPLPPELLEHGGSEDPAKEARLEADLKAEQQLWISAADLPKGLGPSSCDPAKSGNLGRSDTKYILRTGRWPVRGRCYSQLGAGMPLSHGCCRSAVDFVVSRVIQPGIAGRTSSPWQGILDLVRRVIWDLRFH